MAKCGDFPEFRYVVGHASRFNLKNSVVPSLRHANRLSPRKIGVNCVRKIADSLI
jgi:hypothetical protein